MRQEQSKKPIAKKWIFLGLGMLAVIPIGKAAESLDSDRNMQPTPGQAQELTTQHKHILDNLGNLRLDDTGKFQGKAVFSSTESSSMELALQLENDSLVIQSSGQHSGLSKTWQQPYTDPFNFRLTYSVADMNAASATEAFQKLRETPQHMPEEFAFKVSKVRTTPRGTRTRGSASIENHVDFNLGENGALQTIRVGETTLQGNDAVVAHAAATLDLIQHEIELAVTYPPSHS